MHLNQLSKRTLAKYSWFIFDVECNNQYNLVQYLIGKIHLWHILFKLVFELSYENLEEILVSKYRFYCTHINYSDRQSKGSIKFKSKIDHKKM